MARTRAVDANTGTGNPARSLAATLERHAPVGGLTTPAPNATSPPNSFGSDSVCKSASEIGNIAAGIIADKLQITGVAAESLKAELKLYFDDIGISNESQLAQMAAGEFPTDTFEGNRQRRRALNSPVMTCLQEMTGMIAVTFRESLFLTENVSFADLVSASRDIQLSTGNQTPGGATLGQAPTSANEKLPAFEIQPYSDDISKSEEFLNTTELLFRSHALQRFLTDVAYCNARQEHSEAMVARLLTSVARSETLSHLALELRDEPSSKVVWDRIRQSLTSPDHHLAQGSNLWTAYCSLRCDSIDTFDQFYNQTREQLLRLRRRGSAAARDDEFLKGLCAKALDVPDLLSASQDLLLENKGTFDEILERIKSLHGVLVTSEGLRDCSVTPAVRARRGKPSTSAASKPNKNQQELDASVEKYERCFPPNTGTQIPQRIYNQMKAWWDCAR